MTKKKVVEKRERRLSAAVRDSNDAVTVQELGGKILAWNRGAESMYGYTEAEALKMNIRDIVPKEKQKETLQLFRDIEEGKEVKSFRTKRKTKDGEVLDVWLTVTKLVDSKGESVEIATTERDLAWLSKDG